MRESDVFILEFHLKQAENFLTLIDDLGMGDIEMRVEIMEQMERYRRKIDEISG